MTVVCKVKSLKMLRSYYFCGLKILWVKIFVVLKYSHVHHTSETNTDHSAMIISELYRHRRCLVSQASLFTLTPVGSGQHDTQVLYQCQDLGVPIVSDYH